MVDVSSKWKKMAEEMVGIVAVCGRKVCVGVRGTAEARAKSRKTRRQRRKMEGGGDGRGIQATLDGKRGENGRR